MKVRIVNTETSHGEVNFGEAGPSVAMLSSKKKVGSCIQLQRLRKIGGNGGNGRMVVVG